MPIYVFKCKNKNCGQVYETLAKYDETKRYAGVKCPKCGSAKKDQQPHSFSFNFSNPEGTDLWRESHDYRFHHTLPKAKAEREAAEKASKMGTQPYNQIDDLNTGNNFGEVK